MSVQEIKQRIYHLVDDTNDKAALAQFLQNASELLTNQPATLADKQVAGIEKARQRKGMSVDMMRAKISNQFPTASI